MVAEMLKTFDEIMAAYGADHLAHDGLGHVMVWNRKTSRWDCLEYDNEAEGYVYSFSTVQMDDEGMTLVSNK